jgi:alpha/beta superfamily hydrolase
MTGPLPHARTIRIDGPAGALEALYRPPPEPETTGSSVSAPARADTSPSPRAAILCHPHPLYGGTMHNRVIFQLEKALAGAGRATMRFNFRGAGASEGAHDEGRGEIDDVRAVADALVRLVPGTALDVLGYSFGCWVCWRALGEDPRTRTLIGVGVPLRTADFGFAAALRPPITIVQGEEDEYGSGARIRELAATFARTPRLFLIPGADHLFTRGYDRLLAAIPEIVAGL